MPVENTTPNRGYQLPNLANNLEDDVLRLIAAFSAIDVDVAAMLVSIANRALLVHSHVIGDTTGLQVTLDSKQDGSEKGNANGYAALGADGKVPAAQLPAALFGSLAYQTDWNANTNTPTIPAASSGNKGWYYMVSVAGASNVGGYTDWKVGDWAVSDGTKWTKIDNTDAVASVAGLVGAISAASLKAALAIAVADITDASANGRSLISAANYAAMKTLLAITAADITSGTLADARLPARLGLVCNTITDWNAATANGFYMAAGASNAPDGNWYFGQTIAHIEALWLQQDLFGFTNSVAGGDSKHYRRYRANGTWSAWFRVYENGGELDARYLQIANAKLQSSYESAQQTITSGGSLTLAHGLGVKPKLWMGFLQCVTAEGGYSVGDEIAVPTSANASTIPPIGIVPDATNMNVRFGSNGSVFYLNNKSNGTQFTITNANWRFIVRAWA